LKTDKFRGQSINSKCLQDLESRAVLDVEVPGRARLGILCKFNNIKWKGNI